MTESEEAARYALACLEHLLSQIARDGGWQNLPHILKQGSDEEYIFLAIEKLRIALKVDGG